MSRPGLRAYTGRMKTPTRLAALLLAALALPPALAPAAAQTSAGPARLAAPRAALPPLAGEVIVAFKAEAATARKHALAARATPEQAREVLTLRATELGRRLGHDLQAGEALGARVQVVRASGIDAATLASRLAADPEVAYAVPNGRKRRVAQSPAPNDPLYGFQPGRPSGPDSGQWYLRAPDTTLRSAIGIESAWAQTQGSARVVVAVLDTGVRYDHPDLQRRLLPGYDFVADIDVANDGNGRDADPSDPGDWITGSDAAGSKFRDCEVSGSSWHGTSTSSLIGAITGNNLGMAGSAPGTRILPVRVLGKCFGSDSDIIAGMKWAAGIPIPGVPDNPTPAKVINMSLGGGGSCSALYRDTVAEIVARGVTIVAAAGNTAGLAVNEPANCAGVIGVLALRHAGTKVGFSDLGPEISIAAPGGNCVNIAPGTACLYPIVTATNSGSQGPAQSGWTNSFDISLGTSFSSPLVAGVAALVASRNAALTPAQIRDLLRSTARPFPSTGADNGPDDPTPVRQCVPPSSNEQLQCYCTTQLCGAGMLDAGAALAAAGANPAVNVAISPADPVAGESINWRVSGLVTQAGSTPLAYSWQLLDGGAAATGFSTATNADTATLPTTAAGTLRVRLSVTDSLGGTVSEDTTVVVRAVGSAGGGTGGGGTTGGGGGGGGSVSGAWVAGVGLAAFVLGALRRRRSSR